MDQEHELEPDEGLGQDEAPYEQPAGPTLEEYLRADLARGVIDHAIRAEVNGGEVKFYIHPANESGDTLDFAVAGNFLTLIPSES